MPNPTRGDVHVNTPLTNVSVAFLQNAANFVADQVFPNIPVGKKSDIFYTYARGSFNRDEAEERAPATESAGGGYDVSTDTYSAKVYSFHKDIDDQIRDNADSQFDLDKEATQYVTTKALIKREKTWVTNYFTAGAPGTTWTFDVDGVASSPTAEASFDPTNASNNDVLQWNDAASTPIEDVSKGKKYVLESTGFEPNTLVLGYSVWMWLKSHPDILDRIKYSSSPGSPALVNTQAVAAIFEVDRILVMKAIENTAKEGQTASHAFIAGKNALLAYAAPSPGLMTPSAGYTFSWTGRAGAGIKGNRIKRFRMEKLSSDRIEIDFAFDMKKVAADLGYFFGAIVA